MKNTSYKSFFKSKPSKGFTAQVKQSRRERRRAERETLNNLKRLQNDYAKFVQDEKIRRESAGNLDKLKQLRLNYLKAIIDEKSNGVIETREARIQAQREKMMQNILFPQKEHLPNDVDSLIAEGTYSRRLQQINPKGKAEGKQYSKLDRLNNTYYAAIDKLIRQDFINQSDQLLASVISSKINPTGTDLMHFEQWALENRVQQLGINALSNEARDRLEYLQKHPNTYQYSDLINKFHKPIKDFNDLAAYSTDYNYEPNIKGTWEDAFEELAKKNRYASIRKTIDLENKVQKAEDAISEYEAKLEEKYNKDLEKELEKKNKKALKQAEKEAEANVIEKKVSKANELNDALEFASDKFGNRDDYSKYLIPLLKNMDPKFDMKKPKPGDYNGFKISGDYDGNPNNLFKYVSFSDIPDNNPNVDAFTQALLDLDWSSPENYQKHLDEINQKIYNSNVASLGITPASDFYLILESVMQSSAAWRIAARNADDSDQVKSNWDLLYTTGATALDEKDTTIYDTFVQMVFNGEDLDNIIDKIDEMIYKAVKG